MQIVHTHTGKIYVNPEKKLEFLTVGDYGKENNIKADIEFSELSDHAVKGAALRAVNKSINSLFI